MNGAIVYNDGLFRSGCVPLKEQIKKLEASFSSFGVKTEVFSSEDVFVGTDKNEVCVSLGKRDFVVWLDKDVTRAKFLEKAGYKLFNSPKAIEICDDKALTFAELAGIVPLIPTLIPPLSYFGEISNGFLKRVADTFGFPLVVKTRKGSLGAGVFKAESEEELLRIIEKNNGKELIFQKFYGTGGKDFRVIVIGGKAICAMRRENERDFRANVELGGKGFPVALTDDLKGIAEKTAKSLLLDYCGVDVIDGKDGLKICEVNSNAFFGGVTSVTGVPVAKKYAEYIISKFKTV